VFQNYALFPHMTVAGNLAYPLKLRSVGRAEIEERVRRALDIVQLGGLGERNVHQLWAGQRRRVAPARAIIYEPHILIMDEPLSALDKKLRAETQFELMELQRSLGTTFVIVTHDQEEAMLVADRIAVMNQGRLMQVAAPAEIYERPNSRWVAEFIGEASIIEGRRAAAGKINTALGPLSIANGDPGAGKTVWLALRPEKIGIGAQPPEGAANAVAGTVFEIGYRGDMSTYKVRLADRSLMKVAVVNAGAHGRPAFAEGDAVWLTWPPDAGVVLTG